MEWNSVGLMPRKTFLRPGKHTQDRERNMQNFSLLGNSSYPAAIEINQIFILRDFFFPLSIAKLHEHPFIHSFLSSTVFMRKRYLEAFLFLSFISFENVEALLKQTVLPLNSFCYGP